MFQLVLDVMGGLQYPCVVTKSFGVDHAVQDSRLYVQADL